VTRGCAAAFSRLLTPRSPFSPAAGRVGTAYQPSCLSRAPPSGRGVASPRPPNHNKGAAKPRPYHIMPLGQHAVLSLPNNATPQSGDTTPRQRVPMSPCPLAASGRAHLSTFAKAVGRFTPLHGCLSALCPPYSILPRPYLNKKGTRAGEPAPRRTGTPIPCPRRWLTTSHHSRP